MWQEILIGRTVPELVITSAFCFIMSFRNIKAPKFLSKKCFCLTSIRLEIRTLFPIIYMLIWSFMKERHSRIFVGFLSFSIESVAFLPESYLEIMYPSIRFCRYNCGRNVPMVYLFFLLTLLTQDAKMSIRKRQICNLIMLFVW